MRPVLPPLTVLSLLVTSLGGCLPSTSNVVVGHVSGPEYIATLSKRNSGAMSRGSTLISVRLNGVPDNDTHGEIVLALYGDKPVEIKWIGPRNLALSCSSCTQRDVNDEVVKAGAILLTYDDNLRIR